MNRSAHPDPGWREQHTCSFAERHGVLHGARSPSFAQAWCWGCLSRSRPIQKPFAPPVSGKCVEPGEMHRLPGRRWSSPSAHDPDGAQGSTEESRRVYIVFRPTGGGVGFTGASCFPVASFLQLQAIVGYALLPFTLAGALGSAYRRCEQQADEDQLDRVADRWKRAPHAGESTYASSLSNHSHQAQP